jgi:hypothetical protein
VSLRGVGREELLHEEEVWAALIWLACDRWTSYRGVGYLRHGHRSVREVVGARDAQALRTLLLGGGRVVVATMSVSEGCLIDSGNDTYI